MPYISEKIPLNKKLGLDRRIKLTEQDKIEIKYKWFTYKEKVREGILAETVSQRSLAKEYGVSRRLIVWILFPERLKQNRKLRTERGGWKQYYVKEENTKAIAKTRKWKQELYLNKII